MSSAGLIDAKALPDRCSFEVAAVFLNVSFSTIRLWISEGRLPQPRRLGKRPYFSRDDLLKLGEVPTLAQSRAGA